MVLPGRPGLDAAALARAEDAGDPIQALVDSRAGARGFRYRPGGALSDWTLRDYAGAAQPLTATAEVGTEAGQLPAYLLLVGSPAEIPWHVQYMLNPVRQVGRLDLDPAGLASYVTALMSDWSGAACSYAAPLTWAVDTGAGDITTLMREAVAAPLADRFRADTDMPGNLYLDGSITPATGTALADALTRNRPALVVTSSHGMTGPLGDLDLMRSQLGMLVDQAHTVVRPEQLLAGWQPDGAIWFAPGLLLGRHRGPQCLHRTVRGRRPGGRRPRRRGRARRRHRAAAPGAARCGQAAAGVHRPRRADLRLDHAVPAQPAADHLQPPGRALRPAVQRPPGRPRAWVPTTSRSAPCCWATPTRSPRSTAPRSAPPAAPPPPGAIDMAVYSKVTAYDRLAP